MTLHRESDHPKGSHKKSAKKLTKAQLKKRSEIAEAIHEKQPGLSNEKKFKFATAQAKKKTKLRKKVKPSGALLSSKGPIKKAKA